MFDDVKDPYQLHNLSLEENKEVVEQLYREMGAMLKEINDPWYTEKILSDRIPYQMTNNYKTQINTDYRRD